MGYIWDSVSVHYRGVSSRKGSTVCLHGLALACTGFCRLLDQKVFAGACAQYVFCTISIIETCYGHALTGNCLVKQPKNPVAL